MKFSGQHKMELSPSMVWKKLLNPDYLFKLTPVLSTIKTLKRDHYEITTHVKIGHYRHRMTGFLTVKRIVPNEKFCMDLIQIHKYGRLTSNCTIAISPDHSGTLLTYHGHFHLDGLLGRIGMRQVRDQAESVIHHALSHFEQNAALV